MEILEYYPEILRATHKEIVIALTEAGMAAEPAAAIALQTIEWIRKNWGGRTLTRIWWLFDGAEARKTDSAEETAELPLPDIRRDPIRSMRGRELRAAAWGILVLSLAPADLCRLANIVAATAEEYLTGDLVYIPKAGEVDRLHRDQYVWRRFSSLINIDQVIDGTGLSQSQIYTIKRRVQKQRDEHEQPRLPGVHANKG